MEQVPDIEQRLWDAGQAVQHGWSHAVLVHHLDTNRYARQVTVGKNHNFAATLPPPDPDLIAQTLKDPSVLDFLILRAEHHERELERGLLERVQAFLLELGRGFALLGRQDHLAVAGRDFSLDLLFDHDTLRRPVAVELKTGDFEPACAGPLNFSLAALDVQVKHPQDAPSIGLLLGRRKDGLVVDDALRGVSAPIGVSIDRTGTLPAELEQILDRNVTPDVEPG